MKIRYTLTALGTAGLFAVQPLMPVMAQSAPMEIYTGMEGSVLFDFVPVEENGTLQAVLVGCRQADPDHVQTVIEIPEQADIDGQICPVTAIAARAFENSPADEVIVPASVETLEEGAFTDCHNLVFVQLGNPQAFSSKAFENCQQAAVYDRKDTLLWKAGQTDSQEAVQTETEDSSEEKTAARQESPAASGYAADGWQKISGSWKYRENGSYVRKDWRTIDGKTYYFNDSGYMVKGWLKLDDTWYFLSNDGSLSRNRWIGDCYVNDQGIWIEDHWDTQNGKPVYRKGDGTLLRNAWKKKGSVWYWLDSDGYPFAGGWKTIGGLTYYFEADGSMASQVWKGEYYLTAEGHRIKAGWNLNNGRYQYMQLDGTLLKNTRREIQGYVYHFDKNGYMSTGPYTYGGATYIADSNGHSISGAFVKSKNTLYCADTAGHVIKHVFRIDGVRFVPNSTGAIGSVAVNDRLTAVGSGISLQQILGGRESLASKAAAANVIARLGQPTGSSLTKTIDGTSYQLIKFPMKTMKITQGSNGQFSHQGVEALDLAGVNEGIEQAYAPVDMTLKYRDAAATGNALFFESDRPVLFADGTIDYASFMFIHDNYVDDLKSSYKQGEEFMDEGMAGYATGNHIHFEVAKGKLTTCYYKNLYGTYGLRGSVPADQACVIDGVTLFNNGQTLGSGNWMSWKRASQIVKSAGLAQKPAGAINQQGKFWVTIPAVKVRLEPGKNGKTAGYNLSRGQAVVYDCFIRKDGYTWLGFIDKNGARRWVSSGQHNGTVYTERYGVFE